MGRTTRVVCLGLCVALALPEVARAQAAAVDEELATGVRQAQEGDFDAAVVTLDGVVRRLTAQPGRAKDLARAYTYLAISYYGLSQVQMAKARFMEAWRADPEMELSSREFPPRILKFLEESAAEARKAEPPPGKAVPAASPAPTTPSSAGPASAASSPAPTPEKKGKSKTVPILLGVVAAGGIGVAVAGGGGGGGSDSSTSAPQTPRNPTATVSSPVAGQTINCRTAVNATVTVTNPTSTALTITGVRMDTTSTAGGCAPATFTYRTVTSPVAAGATTAVMNQSIYSGGAGCCNGSCDGRSCTMVQAFTVLTSAGDLNAGSFNYVVQYSGCDPCTAAGGPSGAACSPTAEPN